MIDLTREQQAAKIADRILDRSTVRNEYPMRAFVEDALWLRAVIDKLTSHHDPTIICKVNNQCHYCNVVAPALRAHDELIGE